MRTQGLDSISIVSGTDRAAAADTAASQAAARHAEANLRALSERQPGVATPVAQASLDVEWVLARDGYLTARQDGHWASGCSLPRRTAETILKSMELGAVVTCFLAPTHSAQIRVTLDRMGPGKALIVALPDMSDLRLMLGCDGFEDEIREGRLWFACGENWTGELGRLLAENDGLPMPGQFVRTALVDEGQIQEMIRAAQGVFSTESARRVEAVGTILTEPTRSDAICVIVPGAFRLWEAAGGVIGEIAATAGWPTLDTDDPCCASPVALAQAVAGQAAVLIANAGRVDLPAELPECTRVITWVTGGRIPPFIQSAKADALLLVDSRWRAAALSAGWSAERVAIAGWPTYRPAKSPFHNPGATWVTDTVSCEKNTRKQVCPCHPATASKPGAGLAVIADTTPLDMPKFELSSHRLLWETIANELSDDPFAAGDDARAYLARWLKRVGIDESTIDVRCFVDRLIVPAYQQALVRWLIAAGIEVKLFGRGWDRIEALAGRHAGEIHDRGSLEKAIESCAVLVHAWPESCAHPIDAVGRPVLRRGFKGKEMWLNEARRLARGQGKPPENSGPIISAAMVRKLAGVSPAA